MSSSSRVARSWVRVPADLQVERRRPGISGFMRLRNEEEFAALAIESHLPFLDELVVVHNGCTDRTPEIVDDYARRFPDKIRARWYEPEVYPYGTPEYQSLPPDSPHSLVNYYNYALCETTRQVAVKIDGDHVAIPAAFRSLTRAVRRQGLRRLKFWKSFRAYMGFLGLNLWRAEGRLFVNGNYPLTEWDHGFFRVTPATWHVFDPRWEVLERGGLPTWLMNTIAFYHLKGLKSDRGYGNWSFREDAPAIDAEVEKVRQRWHDPRLVALEEYRRAEPMARDLPDPAALGIPSGPPAR
jgi:glycosyltransferase involved in cell wall biosynthesis